MAGWVAMVLAVMAWSSAAAPLQQTSTGYNEALAQYLVNYDGAAYCSGNKDLASWTCYACKKVPGFQNISSVHDPKTDGRGIVGWDPNLKARIVSFMGTDGNIKTWIDDILAVKQKPYQADGCSNCSVHAGFDATWKGLKPQVLTALDTLPPGPVYVTGHSLGAALATLCAIDLATEFKVQPAAVMTVGQPRVGDTNFAAFYHSKVHSHWRATHHRDPIPHLPYQWMGYEHVSTEVYYPSDKGAERTVCNGSGEDPKCADQFDGNLIFITDHWEYLNFSFAQGVIRCI
eukprot:TRINITY_DN15204_c0_g1_i1.p1 TRINITY_DN15204_c0_g1~~TRINITY_DN15204_c0_g1_i1.p1  ORF type:complete len:288 (-),score=54.07 TRINITY_DN15204_c0_g1_i1:272-1135(-)